MARERDRSNDPEQAFDRPSTCGSAANLRRLGAKKGEPLLRIPDVAEILNVSDKQVRRYITNPDPRKRLPVIRIGRLIRIDPSDLENFIRDRRCP